MIRVVGLLLLLASLSSCTILSRQNRVSFEHSKARFGNDACGLYSTRWFTVGRGNLSTVKEDELAVELCSLNHFSDPILQGLVVPFLPTSLDTHDGDRFVLIKNISATSTLRITDDFLNDPDGESPRSVLAQVQFCRSAYTTSDCESLTDKKSETVELKFGQSIWVKLPEKDEFFLNIHTEKKSYRLRGTNKRVYSVWVFTV